MLCSAAPEQTDSTDKDFGFAEGLNKAGEEAPNVEPESKSFTETNRTKSKMGYCAVTPRIPGRTPAFDRATINNTDDSTPNAW